MYGFAVTLSEYAWVCALSSLGSSLIAIPAGPLANCMGRKLITLLMVPPYLAGWALLIFAKDLYMLMAARFLQGFCGGCYFITIPMYCSEVAQVEVKGYLGNFFMVFFVLGIVYAYIMGAFFDYRYLNYGCAILPAIFLLTFIWMPESPVYYLLKNRKNKALRSLRWLRGDSFNAFSEINRMEQDMVKLREDYENTWRKLRHKATFKGLFICIPLTFFQHFCGSKAIITYATFILIEADMGLQWNVELCTIFVGISFLLSTILSLLECAGRRPLLIWSVFLVILNCTLHAMYFNLRDNKVDYLHSLKWLPLFSMCCFTFFFGLGQGVLPFVIIRDIFRENVEVVGSGIVWTIAHFFGFLSTKSFPMTLEAWGMAISFWSFVAISCLSLLFVYFFVPETKGKTYEEIHSMLDSKTVQ
ncbi:facilitated trehalose transporter Tret1-like isoform X2 [Drosophila montana]